MTELESSITAYFGVMDAQKLEIITSFFQPETIKRGDYFLETGKKCDRLSFMKSGLMRIFVALEKKDVTQWITTKGYFVTDLSSFVFDEPARWTIQALTDTEIYTLHKRDYAKLSALVPDWIVLEKLFIARCFTIMENRIFSHLSMSAEERYAQFFESNKELFNQVPLQYIASMLGMTPETFSRIRKKQLQ